MIVRSISDEHLPAFLKDFNFLFERVRLECGELDLRLRDDYFNLYYKGNALAKVSMSAYPYRIDIHRVFADHIFPQATFGTPQLVSNKYLRFRVSRNLLHPFFSKEHIKALSSRIAKRNYGGEITFEQMLITDNLNREEFHIIDRQVCGGSLGRKKMDALALEQLAKGSRQYRFVLLEAKLGNNSELAGQVGRQLQHYLTVMTDNFSEFKKCYERTYQQMRQTNIFTHPAFESIEIVGPVNGWVVVGGYSGIAERAITQLLAVTPDIKVRKMFHRW